MSGSSIRQKSIGSGLGSKPTLGMPAKMHPATIGMTDSGWPVSLFGSEMKFYRSTFEKRMGCFHNWHLEAFGFDTLEEMFNFMGEIEKWGLPNLRQGGWKSVDGYSGYVNWYDWLENK